MDLEIIERMWFANS